MSHDFELVHRQIVTVGSLGWLRIALSCTSSRSLRKVKSLSISEGFLILGSGSMAKSDPQPLPGQVPGGRAWLEEAGHWWYVTMYLILGLVSLSFSLLLTRYEVCSFIPPYLPTSRDKVY